MDLYIFFAFLFFCFIMLYDAKNFGSKKRIKRMVVVYYRNMKGLDIFQILQYISAVQYSFVRTHSIKENS